jgi:putative hemolysin
MNRILITLAVTLLLAACSSAPKLVRPPRQEAGMDANRRARELLARGDLAGATVQARKARDLAASIEDEDALAVSQLILSSIHQRLDQPAEARRAVDAILADKYLRYPATRVAEAGLRRAVLALEDGERERAESLVTAAESACGRDCVLTGKLLNLRAQLAIERTQLEQAVAMAIEAQGHCARQGDEEEVANALRLRANALILLKRPQDAMSLLGDALAADKRIGASRKIYRDLLLLGIAARGTADGATAASYFNRAASVARADGYSAGVAEVESIRTVKETP